MSKSFEFTQCFNQIINKKDLNSKCEVFFLKNFIVNDYELFFRKNKFLIELESLLPSDDIDEKYNGVNRFSEKYIASLPWNDKNLSGMNKYIKDILGYDYYTSPGDKKFNYAMVNDFYVWGEDHRNEELSNKRLAAKNNKRLIRLEYGFISSKDIALKESPQHSLILCPEVMYYDATKVSDMERCLNDNSVVFF
ncbi:hypothetical protein HJ057_16695 [Vibrio parahaemolyticus]|nr:hypothetical protein [Vibrio parahaemolyticus]